MKKHQTLLERANIGRPCSSDWDEMTGDARTRYCQQCDKTVHNFSQMSRAEIEALLSTTQGRLCARIERRADGTILTQDQSSLPVVMTRLRFRASKIAAAAMSAALSFSANAALAQASEAGDTAQIDAPQKQDKENQKSQETGQQTGISGTVIDASGAVIPATRITLLNEATGREMVTASSGEGRYQFSALEPGEYKLTFEQALFKKTIVTGIVLRAGQMLSQNVTLNVTLEVRATLGDLVFVEEPLKTTDSQIEGKLMEPKIANSSPERKTKRSIASILWSVIRKLNPNN